MEKKRRHYVAHLYVLPCLEQPSQHILVRFNGSVFVAPSQGVLHSEDSSQWLLSLKNQLPRFVGG
jgi:hypothetical protein